MVGPLRKEIPKDAKPVQNKADEFLTMGSQSLSQMGTG